MNGLEPLVVQALGALGYELADLEISNRGKSLRVFIDKPHQVSRPGSEAVGLADCEAATRQLQRVLEVEGIDYDRLEVSSPGLDRKLKKTADFERFAGQEVEVRLRRLLDGRRRFAGTIVGVVGECVEVEAPEGRFKFELADLERARLVPKL